MLTVVMSFFSVFVIIFLVFPFREFARGWVAKQLGDNTAEQAGMLTMNPLAHIDWMGALCMCLCCIGWTKPVPISINRCRKVNQSTAIVLVSLTGPLSMFLLGFILMIIAKVIWIAVVQQQMIDYLTMMTAALPVSYYVFYGIMMAAQICSYLAVLNLIPVPPFDGYYIIAGILPRKAAIWMETNARIINLVVLMLLISGLLSVPLQFLSSLMLKLMNLLTIWIVDISAII